MEDSQDAKPSILEYARFYGLTQDYRKNAPLDAALVPNIPSKEDIHHDLDDETNMFTIQKPVGLSHIERLVVEKEAALVLPSLGLPISTVTNSVLNLLDVRMTRNMKLETPILRTDHELDVIHFRKGFKPCTADLKLPLENVGDDND